MTLIVPQLGLGGTEKQIVLLACGLHDAGVDVEVVVLYDGGPRQGDLERCGVPVTLLGMARSPRRLGRSAWATLRLLRHLRSRRPDVVHAFLFEAYVLCAPLARVAGVPVVVAGRRALSDYKSRRRWARRLESAAARACDLFIANSVAVASDVVKHERLDPARVVVVPNAVSTPPTAPSTRAPHDQRDRAVVLCVANLWPYKGHSDLLDAVAMLRDRGHEVRLVLVGDGSERDAIRAKAAGQQLDVELLGARDDVDAHLRAADVFVLPSHTEGMSNALMEAVAHGLPVVATDVGGNPEVVGGAGLLCPPHRPELLADALQRILDDPVEAAAMRIAGPARAAEWRVDRLVRRHVEEYGKVLAQRCVA